MAESQTFCIKELKPVSIPTSIRGNWESLALAEEREGENPCGCRDSAGMEVEPGSSHQCSVRGHLTVNTKLKFNLNSI